MGLRAMMPNHIPTLLHTPLCGIFTLFLSSDLSVSWPADHPVSVNGYGHDGEGGHEHCQAGEALQHPDKIFHFNIFSFITLGRNKYSIISKY